VRASVTSAVPPGWKVRIPGVRYPLGPRLMTVDSVSTWILHTEKFPYAVRSVHKACLST